jgi:hypothetical protein
MESCLMDSLLIMIRNQDLGIMVDHRNNFLARLPNSESRCTAQRGRVVAISGRNKWPKSSSTVILKPEENNFPATLLIIVLGFLITLVRL